MITSLGVLINNNIEFDGGLVLLSSVLALVKQIYDKIKFGAWKSASDLTEI